METDQSIKAEMSLEDLRGMLKNPNLSIYDREAINKKRMEILGRKE